MEKQCKKCLQNKSIDNFYKKPDMADGHCNLCRECRTTMQRDYRNRSHNKATVRYEKTKQGFLMRLYRNMESRIKGVQKEKFHLYAGKELLSREEFYDWAHKQKEFHILFAKWEESGYDRKLAPSPDRVNSKLGYNENNMEWVTHSVNSSRGATNKKGQKYSMIK